MNSEIKTQGYSKGENCNRNGCEGIIDEYEYDNQQAEVSKNNKSLSAAQEKYKIFLKKWRGEIPADKLEIRTEGYGHFSIKKIGVFPKGSETKDSLLPKVEGTFGGKFTTDINENSHRFKYIAYTAINYE